MGGGGSTLESTSEERGRGLSLSANERRDRQDNNDHIRLHHRSLSFGMTTKLWNTYELFEAAARSPEDECGCPEGMGNSTQNPLQGISVAGRKFQCRNPRSREAKQGLT